MKYAALLTNEADAVAAWEAMSPEEAAAARAEEVPKWEALFGELRPGMTEAEAKEGLGILTDALTAVNEEASKP